MFQKPVITDVSAVSLEVPGAILHIPYFLLVHGELVDADLGQRLGDSVEKLLW